MDQVNVAVLKRGLEAVGVGATDEAVDAIVRHLELVREWNEQVNLTAITDEVEMVLKHAVDSATAVLGASLRAGSRVVDVGTGAGFPGVVIKCLFPSIGLTLVESLAKRCRFLEKVGEDVIGPLAGDGSGYEVVWGRAEDVARNPAYREQFDLVTARAVADLRVLSEYCLPFCKIGGAFVAMKGPSAAEEVEAARGAIERLGGSLESVESIHLPEGAGERMLVRIQKARRTPPGYPRKAGTPNKSPL